MTSSPTFTLFYQYNIQHFTKGKVETETSCLCNYVVLYVLLGKRNEYIWVHIKDTRFCQEVISKFAQQGLKLTDLSSALC